MADFATADDVAGVWRTLTLDEEVVAGNLVTYASAIVRRHVLDIDARIAAGDLDAALATLVVAEMVARKLKNPDGYRSETESIDDYAHTVTRDGDLAPGGLFITDTELATLRKDRSRSFSVAPSVPDVTPADLERVARLRVGWDARDRC